MRQLGLAISLLLSLAACGGDDDEPAVDAPKACRDVADAFGDICQRCSFDTYQACYDGFVQGVANGDCDNIIGVRDNELLYGSCIPSLRSVSCEVAGQENWQVDSSCMSQLQR